MSEKLKTRAEVPVEETWDLSLIYKKPEELEKDLSRIRELAESMEGRWKGQLGRAEAIAACMEDVQELKKLETLAYTYTDLAVSVDRYDSAAMERSARVMSMLTELDSRLSFIQSELAEAPEAELRKAADLSAGARVWLLNVLREKPHRLHPEAERVLAACG